jgi:HAD superfamily hydrolase (TIGR01509 family)
MSLARKTAKRMTFFPRHRPENSVGDTIEEDVDHFKENKLQTTDKEFSSRMKLKLPSGSFRAYLFDCDGTIIDSMPLHYIAWKTALGEWGCDFDEKVFYAWGGKPTRKIVSDLNEINGLKMPVEAVARHKEELYFELLPQLKAIPEVMEHINAQQGKIPFAVVSGGRRESVTRSLKVLDLLDRFETIVGSDDYIHGKPAPDAFLMAAKRLGVAPKDCLVFEDTDLGIAAATAAGMASVKVPAPWERN